MNKFSNVGPGRTAYYQYIPKIFRVNMPAAVSWKPPAYGMKNFSVTKPSSLLTVSRYLPEARL